MFKRILKFASVAAVSAAFPLWLAACGSINDSWESRGGGYLKYTLNNEGPFSIELAKNDVEPPFYVNNSHSYFLMRTRPEESDRKDQLSLMVNKPSTNGKLPLVGKASINGRYQDVTWFSFKGGPRASLVTDSSYIHFDEIIKDSLYTANVELYFKDCRSGTCLENMPPIHLSGRLRYWLPDDVR